MFEGYLQALLHKKAPNHYSDTTKEKNILLIPGLFTSWHFLQEIGNYFSRQGYQVHVVPEIGYNKNSIEQESKNSSIFREA